MYKQNREMYFVGQEVEFSYAKGCRTVTIVAGGAKIMESSTLNSETKKEIKPLQAFILKKGETLILEFTEDSSIGVLRIEQ